MIKLSMKDSYITTIKNKDYFPLVSEKGAAPLYAGQEEFPGVIRVLKHLKADIEGVTIKSPELFREIPPGATEVVLIGTLGKSPLIDGLVEKKKIDGAVIKGKREAFLIRVVEEPLPGINRGLVIAGSDKRGTIYGLFDLSEKIGVSPWYWWADVPIPKKSELYVLPGSYTRGEPAVKYRGFFINDESPCLKKWVGEKFDGVFNHEFYKKVFELLLRLKGNLLWPAMWDETFYVDDPLNPKLADEYGIVMSTSHHEPMMRAWKEWRRNGCGEWNYQTNKENIRSYWKESIERTGSLESIVTLGMRGDGDEPMTEKNHLELLEEIVKDQRNILTEVTGKDPAEIPQLWAVYKEVQDYYDRGMRVPGDVTVMFCDDNWGNLRHVPEPGAPGRAGGYGLYYHFDYVGGPRNYKWINTSPIQRVWEQLNLAFRYGIQRMWIVNVGDIKPQEFPTQFFLDYAWDPDSLSETELDDYTRLWAEQQFGEEHGAAIAGFLNRYTKYNGRRKPELIEPDTYSLVNYREAEIFVKEYNALEKEASALQNSLPEEYHEAYYQLVLHPIEACANLNELHITTGLNRLYAAQGRAATNDMADKVTALFNRDAAITHHYNKVLAGGKWNHMMDQTHISYTYWQQPEKDVLPDIERLDLPAVSEMGVAIEGSASWWPGEESDAQLPEFTPYPPQPHYMDIFNRGTVPFEYAIQTDAAWLKVTPRQGRIEKEQRLWVNVDWSAFPGSDMERSTITVKGPGGREVTVRAVIHNFKLPGMEGFIEGNGYVSMEAEHFTANVAAEGIRWHLIPGLGRTLSGMTPLPAPVESRTPGPGGNGPVLEYRMYLRRPGQVKVHAFLSPANNFLKNNTIRYAVSFNNGSPRIINTHAAKKIWDRVVADNIMIPVSIHDIPHSGVNVLKFWMVDPGVVLQKLVVETEGFSPCYLGPPESYFHGG